jgi:ribokinase
VKTSDVSIPILISVGSINVDFQCKVGEDLSRGGTLEGTDFVQRAGGKGANRAYFAANVDVPAKLIGRVGPDHFAERALAPLHHLKLDLAGVSVSPAAATGVSMIAVPETGDKTILLCANANQDWDEEALRALDDTIGQAPQGSILAMDFEIAREAVETLLTAAGSRGLRVVADGSFAAYVERRDLTRLYAIAPNVQEAAAISKTKVHDEADAERAARALMEAGTTLVCVKLPDGGCILASEGNTIKVVAPSVKVIDKTGAGDAFTAALAIALLENRTERDAAVWGVAASSIAVTGQGSQEAYPTRSALDRMIEIVHQSNQAGRS